jgi:putative membrane protein
VTRDNVPLRTERRVVVPFDIYYGHPGNFPWIAGALWMILFWAGVVIVFVLVARHFGHTHHEPTTEPVAMDTLKMRFARGEIDVDEFQHRADLLKHTKDY